MANYGGLWIVPRKLSRMRYDHSDLLYGSCTEHVTFQGLTVPNLLPNMDECKSFEIRTLSSLSKGQTILFFSWV